MKVLRYLARVIQRVWACFVEVDAIQHAGAIAYFGLLSILPLVILSAAILAQLVAQVPGDDSGLQTVDEVLNQFSAALPFLAGDARELIATLAEQRASISIVSGVLLLLGSSAVFTAMERGINAVLRTKGHRHYLVSKLILASLVISAGAITFVWHVVRSVAEAWFTSSSLALPTWLFQGIIWQWIVSLLIPGVGFYLMVKFMAQRRFDRDLRWVGAGVFAALFNVAHLGLQYYLNKMVWLQQLYGTAGAFLGLTIWLLLAAIVLLVSCAVIRTLSELREEAQQAL